MKQHTYTTNNNPNPCSKAERGLNLPEDDVITGLDNVNVEDAVNEAHG